MKAKSLRNYKKNGKDVFVYAIHKISAEDAETYEAIQGTKLRHDKDSGNMLFFSVRYSGEDITLNFNQDKTGVYVDTSEIDKARSIAEQYGADFGAIMVQQFLSTKAPAPAPVTTPVEEPSDDISKM